MKLSYHNLYYYAETDTEHTNTDYGTRLAKYTFLGIAGGSLTYELYKRNESGHLIEALTDIEGKEYEELVEKDKELKTPTVDGEGAEKEARVTFTGINSRNHVIYKHILVNNEYVMLMRIDSPAFKEGDNNDRNQKRYVHECIYRFCGFRSRNELSPRTYQMFIDNKENQ